MHGWIERCWCCSHYINIAQSLRWLDLAVRRRLLDALNDGTRFAVTPAAKSTVWPMRRPLKVRTVGGMTRNFPPGDIRVSDADRDAAITELSEHFQAGRLTQEEFDERSGLALRARTGNDLSELFTDLPQLSPGPQSPPQPPGPSPVPPWAPEPWPARPVGRRGHPFPPILAGIIAVIVVSNIAGDIGGQVHHPVVSWVVIVVILLVAIQIARRARRRR